MNFNKIVVFDFETDSTNPASCNPVQLASVIIDPRNLTMVSDSEFQSMMRPLDIDDDDYFIEHEETIKWHAENRRCSPEEIIQLWKKAPNQREVWHDFENYLLRYHTHKQNQSKFSAPIAAGYNIWRFDLIIVDRLCAEYHMLDNTGTVKLFHPRDKIDAMLLSFMWFENFDVPKSYSMDSLREYFGMDTENAHDAMKDVYDTAELVIRFMRITRKFSAQVKFKNAFKKRK